jgi:UDP-N-acetylglucosamine--N-acetylmuramyl-(pentapeptide) pyrophosphoryl-undecaprenol N-acetylglucosamine transferase
LIGSIFEVRRLLKQGQFDGVFTTGGYIAAPAILAARSLGLPAILHESNAFPGKVTRWLSPWCSVVALGFEASTAYLRSSRNVCVGTPVRSQFRTSEPIALTDLPIPEEVPLLVIVGGSQGAVAVNQLVRQAAPAWLEEGIWVVHLTGDNDPDVKSLSHPHYLALPFYNNMAGLLQRANLVISRAGAGSLTEIAVTQTPSILIPYPFAADDHQTYNAAIFAAAGAACVYRQADLTATKLQEKVLNLLRSPEKLQTMTEAAGKLAIVDSAERLANLVKELVHS